MKESSGMSPQLSHIKRKPQFYVLSYVHSSVFQSFLLSLSAIPPLDVSSLSAGNSPDTGATFGGFIEATGEILQYCEKAENCLEECL